MDAFIELDINPAKVVALYPEKVSGRLHVPPERWIPLFGGPEPKARPEELEDKVRESGSQERRHSLVRTPSPSGSLRSIKPFRKGTLDSILPSSMSASLIKDDDRASLRGRAVSKTKPKSGGRFETIKEGMIN